MSNVKTAASGNKTYIRILIVVILFVVTLVNYADRATMGVANSSLSKEFGFSKADMGWLLSAFGWSYVVAQIPGGWLLDRYGSRLVYAVCIFFWSALTLLQGTVGFLQGAAVFSALFALRLAVGVAEAPSFPGNARFVAAWFPKNERGTASAFFNSGQYFATVVFAPFMAWLTASYGWRWMFIAMGALGILVAGIWLAFVFMPRNHPRVNKAEVDYIREGGGLVDIDGVAEDNKPRWEYLGQLLSNRMLVGIYLGQYCINTLTTFFLTWFFDYLVTERGMSVLKAGFAAILPALFGFFGGVLGGILSDYILRRTDSLTLARKIPIIGGMVLSMVIIACNYVSDPFWVIVFMSAAFFGKGVGALGWAVMADTAPKEAGGLAGGLFNAIGNVSTITTPIAIGYILTWTGSFNYALVFVAINALVAAIAYLFIVGKIERFQLK